MKILVLGGTKFVGRSFVETALYRGHSITIFNRGLSPALPGCERLIGDRTSNVASIQGRCWDVVFDTWAGDASFVETSVAHLSGNVRQYVFVSTISVYANFSTLGTTEKAPLISTAAARGDATSIYRFNKAMAENALRSVSSCEVLVLRPGIIVGPNDYIDHLGFWVRQLRKQGCVQVPDARDRPVQLIDVRDLCSWSLDLVEKGRSGVFNAVGPATPLLFNEVIHDCHRLGGCVSEIKWVDELVLSDPRQPATDWTRFPLWIPEQDLEYRGFFSISNVAAVEAGLTFRPLDETILSLMDDRSGQI